MGVRCAQRSRRMRRNGVLRAVYRHFAAAGFRMLFEESIIAGKLEATTLK